MHTTLIAVDIVGFGDHRRTDGDRIYLHETMYEQAIRAFAMTGLPWWDCHREDRGDGAFIVAPARVNADLFLDPLAHHRAVSKSPVWVIVTRCLDRPLSRGVMPKRG